MMSSFKEYLKEINLNSKMIDVSEEWKKHMNEVEKKEWKKFMRELTKAVKGKEIRMSRYMGGNPENLIPKKVYQNKSEPFRTIYFVDKNTNKEWELYWDKSHHTTPFDIL